MRQFQNRSNDRRNLVRRMQDAKKVIDHKEAEKNKAAGKTEIGKPSDGHEQEADAMAKELVRGGNDGSGTAGHTSTQVQRAHDGGSETGALIAGGNDGPLKGTSEFDAKLNSSKGGGQALNKDTMADMENKMGAELSDVKVHTDGNADEMARGINAKAFTHGQDIYFRQGNYNTSTAEGKSLLAHELTHTQQQSRSIERKVQRAADPVGLYAGSAINYTTPFSSLSAYSDEPNGVVSGYNYWYRKLSDLYKVKLGWSGSSRTESSFNRFVANLDEENAVLSKAWELKPAKVPVKGDPSYETSIQVTATKTNLNVKEQHTVHYTLKYYFDEAAGAATLDVGFNMEIPSSATAVDLTIPQAKDVKVKDDVYTEIANATSSGFPEGNNLSGYFAKHPEVKTAIGGFLQTRRDEAVLNKKRTGVQNIISVTEKSDNANGNKLNIFVQCVVSSTGDINALTLTYSTESGNKLNDQYNTHDYIDYMTESQYAAKPLDPERVTYDGLDAITDKNERLIAKKVALDIFKSTTTDKGVTSKAFRDTEVDQIIPVTNADHTDYYYYTFIVSKPDAQNNVKITIKRIGKKGDNVVGDPRHLSITNVYGYGTHAYNAKKEETPAALVAWILKRYPKVILKTDIDAKTVAEIVNKTDNLMNAKAGKPEWFANYGVTIKDKAGGKTFLKNSLKLTEAEAAGTDTFSEEELKLLEQAFQNLNSTQLGNMSGVIFIRQDANHEAKYASMNLSGLTREPNTYYPSTGAMTYSSRSITYYTGAFKSQINGAWYDKANFIGGAGGVKDSALATLNHEMGHVAGNKHPGDNRNAKTAQDIFNAFYKARNISPITGYSRSNEPGLHSPDSEFFPDTYYIFLNDPEWLLTNQPQLYLWFLYFQTNGSAPALVKIGSLIDAWTALKNANAQAGISETYAFMLLWQKYYSSHGAPAAATIATLVALQLAFFAKNNYLADEATAAKLITALNKFTSANPGKQPDDAQVQQIVNGVQ